MVVKVTDSFAGYPINLKENTQGSLNYYRPTK
jgi:hypothetical protein